MFFAPRLPRRGAAHELRLLCAHIAQLEAKIMDLSNLLIQTTQQQQPERERTAWNGPTSTVPIAPARLKPTRLVSQPLEFIEERQISHVIVTPSHKVVSYDQAGIPWLDFCGEFRRVGWKILQNFKGRWQEVSYEVELPETATATL